MSTSSGDPRPQVAEADDNNRRPVLRDVEQGDLDTENQRYLPNPQGVGSSNEENLDNEPDEYTRLLKFIDLQAKKEKRRSGGDGGDGGDQEMRRLWYMPWKKVPVEGIQARRVPQTWLETDMTKGLSDSDVDDRRARLGYNELERCVDQNLQKKRLSFLHTAQGSIPLSSLLATSVARFFSVCAAFRTHSLHSADVPPTVMELAVLLAAGLRDWIDFGVIVRFTPDGPPFFLSKTKQ
jgi:H+-transporting ATPase